MTTPTAPALTLADVTTFILASATQADIDRIHAAAKTRTRHLFFTELLGLDQPSGGR